MSRWLGLREEQRSASTLIVQIAHLFPEVPPRAERLRKRQLAGQTRGWVASIDGR